MAIPFLSANEIHLIRRLKGYRSARIVASYFDIPEEYVRKIWDNNDLFYINNQEDIIVDYIKANFKQLIIAIGVSLFIGLILGGIFGGSIVKSIVKDTIKVEEVSK